MQPRGRGQVRPAAHSSGDVCPSPAHRQTLTGSTMLVFEEAELVRGSFAWLIHFLDAARHRYSWEGCILRPWPNWSLSGRLSLAGRKVLIPGHFSLEDQVQSEATLAAAVTQPTSPVWATVGGNTWVYGGADSA